MPKIIWGTVFNAQKLHTLPIKTFQQQSKWYGGLKKNMSYGILQRSKSTTQVIREKIKTLARSCRICQKFDGHAPFCL